MISGRFPKLMFHLPALGQNYERVQPQINTAVISVLILWQNTCVLCVKLVRMIQQLSKNTELSPPNKGDDRLEKHSVNTGEHTGLVPAHSVWVTGDLWDTQCTNTAAATWAAERETIKETASAASRPSLVFYRAALHTSAGTSRPSVELLDFFFFFSPRCFSPHYTADGTSEQMRFAPSVPQNVPVTHARIIQFSALHQLSAGGPRGVPLHMHECTNVGKNTRDTHGIKSVYNLSVFSVSPGPFCSTGSTVWTTGGWRNPQIFLDAAADTFDIYV